MKKSLEFNFIDYKFIELWIFFNYRKQKVDLFFEIFFILLKMILYEKELIVEEGNLLIINLDFEDVMYSV